MLHTFNINNKNIDLSNVRYLTFKETTILFMLSQITVYSSVNYSYLIENMNINNLVIYIKIFETFWNLIFNIFLENNFNKNKFFGIIIISSGLIIYNK